MSESFFLHPQGINESSHIGRGTRIWAHTHILSGAVIGEDCNICDGVFVENDVIVGDRVTIKSGVQLWDGVRLGNDVFIGPNATFSNDYFPRSGRRQTSVLQTIVHDGASIGANATLLPGLVIGENAMIGAGAVVTHNVPPNAIVYGNPARIQGYVANTNPAGVNVIFPSSTTGQPSGALSPQLPGGARLLPLTSAEDMRGSLTAIDFTTQLPFFPQRFFTVYGVPTNRVRGEHAHRTCQQFITCFAGSISVLLDDGFNREAIDLNDGKRGLYLPPLLWSTQYKHSPDAVIGVFASEAYDSGEYIRSYEEFKKIIGK